ncbi:serine O-acetyltransferase [Enterococcus gilvus]|uniref:serine O-acetyltransferase n=1 Tax=Enterococcus gilvus TaxID=160453 RepID=UPI00345EF2B0
MKDQRFYHEFSLKQRIKFFMINDHWYQIRNYIRYLRLEEKYFNSGNRLFSNFFCRKKNILGNKLGFYISKNTLGEGVTIYHHGSIIISGNAKIGNNVSLHGNNCIGNDGNSDFAPIIGDSVDIGFGACIIGSIEIAKGVKIGAGAVVVKSCFKEGATLIGVPARIIESEQNNE